MPGEQDDLDRILDAGLATYSAQEPWPGIEQRVLARLPKSRRSKLWLRWMIPVPVLAGLLLLAGHWTAQRAPEKRMEEPVVASVRPVERAAPAPPLRIVQKPVRRKAVGVTQKSARPEVFPTPSPMTPEERAVLQLAALNPESLQSAMYSQESMNRPIVVEPINIPPLTNGDSLED